MLTEDESAMTPLGNRCGKTTRVMLEAPTTMGETAPPSSPGRATGAAGGNRELECRTPHLSHRTLELPHQQSDRNRRAPTRHR